MKLIIIGRGRMGTLIRETAIAAGDEVVDTFDVDDIDRLATVGKIADVVIDFSNPAALELLNGTVWPYVYRAVEVQLQNRAPQPCAIDAIGLLESGLGALCSHTVAVTAPESDRVARLMAREGISEEYARLRIRAQKSDEVFAAACSMTIHNNFDSAARFQAHCKVKFQQLLKEDVQL